VNDVRSAYSELSGRYIETVGTIGHVHPDDLNLATRWAADVTGPVLDAGCGPGQWSEFLAGLGLDVTGVDQVPEFIAHARAAVPEIDFSVGDLCALDAADASFGGVLSFYSLVHFRPETIHEPLAEFARVLQPGGRMLVGFFAGSVLESFPHKVVTAYCWPTEALADALDAAGFEVLETHTRAKPGARTHGAIIAERRGG